tara:strand:+ start:152 stop:520 length:369 start_codon:yes stop_codon:yes gene_type:complete
MVKKPIVAKPAEKKAVVAKPVEKKAGLTASIIKVVNKDAKIKSRPGSSRYKRLAVLLQNDGKTIREFYADCNKQVDGSVSKKLIVVAVKQGLIERIEGLSEEDMGRYNYKRKAQPKALAAAA